jgi:hypothetical protein
MYSGSVTYSYYSATQNVFDKIADMRTVELPIAQYIGQYKNVLDTIDNAKTELVKILNMRFSLRPVQKAYFIVEYVNNQPVSSGYYKDAKGLEKIDSDNVDGYAIYQVYTKT